MNLKYLMKSIQYFIIYLVIISYAECSNQSKNPDIRPDRIDTPTTLTSTDSKFIVDAAELSLEGIDMGKLAQINSDNQNIKDLGRELVIDYRKILNQLKVIGIHKTISLPDEMNSTGRDSYEKLMVKKGNEFDNQVSSVIISIDTSAIHLFEQEAKYAQDTEVKECLASSLPILKSNLMNIQSIKDTLHKVALQ